jgi:predicted deacylase
MYIYMNSLTQKIFLIGLLALSGLFGWIVMAAYPVHAGQTPIREFTIGLSRQERPVTAVQIGTGARKLVIVGDTHGGPEANTYTLTLQLIDHFRTFPEEVPPDVRLYLIPTINPDGLAIDSRFDSLGVDLNRNMDTTLDDCPENDWRKKVNGAYGIVSDTGGPFPESQIESRIIRNFLLDASGAIFLHSNAGLVFPASCEHQPSIRMAQLYAEAANYTYERYWTNYVIHGSMPDWASSLGIAAITPELFSATESEFDQNLAGIRAVLNNHEALLPLPEDQIENDIIVPALIWRYWKSHGGEALFGLPLQPAQTTSYGMSQVFSQARLELRPALADTPFLVQPAPLGRELMGFYTDEEVAYTTSVAPVSDPDTDLYLQPVPLGPSSLFFDETGYTLTEAFLIYWQLYGGADVLGYPISVEYTARAADGQMRVMQHFENTTLVYYPEDESVRPEPLGWQLLLIKNVQGAYVDPQVR